jgi:hypothetical protein
VLLAAIGSLALRHWLHSESFRALLSREAGRAVGIDGSFSPLRWEGLALDARSFSGKGKGPIRELQLEGLHTEVGLGRIWNGAWELRNSSIRRIELSLNGPGHRIENTVRSDADTSSSVPPASLPTKSRKFFALPERIELGSIDVRDLTIGFPHDRGSFTLRGTRMGATQESSNRSWLIEAQGGLLESPITWIPPARLDRLKGRWRDGIFHLSELRATSSDNATLTASGEWNRDTKETIVDGSVVGIPCETLLPRDWSKHLAGHVDATVVMRRSRDLAQAEGTIELRRGVLTALPFLDALDAYADTSRFRHITLTEARSEWAWHGENQTSFRRIVLACDGLVRLEGECTVRGRILDGNFQLGIAPGTLSRIPGAENQIFQPGPHGLLWAPLKLTGTLDDPKEDLSERLVAEAGVRMIQRLPESVVQKLPLDLNLLRSDPQQAVEQVKETLREGPKTIEEVGGLIDSILKSKKQKKNDEKQSEPER